MTQQNDKPNAIKIFDEACEMPSEDRASFIIEECGNDDALRTEVESLLEQHFTQAKTMFEDVQTELATDYTSGDTIGQFKILRVLGEGGMGIVYLAEQSRPVKRRVALKIIKAGMDTKQVIARFEAERQALAIMNHPGIAQVYEAGSTDRGRPYFVLEYVKGTPITEACDEPKFNTEMRLELMAKVCDAVQHAHMKGIIHRDLKPSNILVATGPDDTPEPKIIDFGVAKATSQQLTEKTLVTQVGRFIGTPLYMSPEQADLKPTDIDTRTDVYALGVILYELLSGIPPFDPHTLRDAGLEEMQRIIRSQQVPKPSTKLSSVDATVATRIAAARQTQTSLLTGKLRKELEWIPLKALRKSRSERYDSAKAMGDDIRRYLNNEALEAGPEKLLYLAKKLLQRHNKLVAVAIVITFLLAAGVMSTMYFVVVAQQQAMVAEIERTKTAAMVEYSTASLSPGINATPIQLNQVFWQSHIQDLQNKISELFSAYPEQQSSMYVALARSKLAHNSLSEIERTALFDRAADILRIKYGDKNLQVLLYELEAIVEDENPSDDTLILARSTFNQIAELNPSVEIRAQSLLLLAMYELYQFQKHEHETHLQKLNYVPSEIRQQGHVHADDADRLFAIAGETYDTKRLALFSRRAWSYIWRDSEDLSLSDATRSKQLLQAKKILEENYLPLAKKIEGGKGNKYFKGRVMQGVILDRLGRFREAINVHTETLEYQRRFMGEGHNSTWQTMGNLAVSYSHLSRETSSETEKQRLQKMALELWLDAISQSVRRENLENYAGSWYYNTLNTLLPEHALDDETYKQWLEAIQLSPLEFIEKYLQEEDTQINDASGTTNTN